MSKNDAKSGAKKTFTSKEIGLTLNNALVVTFGAVGLRELGEKRKAKLRDYTRAIMDVVLDHRKQGLLTAEELVAVLTAVATMVHVLLVQGGSLGKLPAYEALTSNIAKDIEDAQK
jgi:hypothetical protein